MTSGKMTATARKKGAPAGNLQSIDRSIALVRATAYSPAGLRLTELSDAVGLSKSTTHRIVSTLVRHGLLRLSEGKRVYTPGGELYRLGIAAAHHFSLVEIARPSLQRLAELTEDTVFLSIIDGRDALCLDRVSGHFPIKALTLAIGDRRPLGVGAGSLALLAALPEDEWRAIVAEESQRLPRYGAFTAPALTRWALKARRQGFAYNPERIVAGMSAVAVAIRGGEGRPIGAISVAAIAQRMPGERLEWVIDLLQRECDAVATLAATLQARDQA